VSHRWSWVLAAVVIGASCTGAEEPTPQTSRVTLASGQPLPGCTPQPSPAEAFPVSFVAEGSAWAVRPDGSGVRCLFPVEEPGPFTWGPLGDRALLGQLQVRQPGGELLRPGEDIQPGPSSWGHPMGTAVAFVSPDQRSLQKAILGQEKLLNITPVPDVRYLSVAYHWSGLGLGFAVDRNGKHSIWFSNNLGEDPRRVVFTEKGTEFGAIAFEQKGKYLVYAAQHAEGYPHLHRLDLNTGRIPGLWKGEIGQHIWSIEPGLDPSSTAFELGTSCADSRAMVTLSRNEAREVPPDEDRPTRTLGWVDDGHVLVAAGPCEGPLDLSVVDVASGDAVPVASGVDAGAVRTPITTPTNLPPGATVDIPPGAA
jgi:hypothetical protein